MVRFILSGRTSDGSTTRVLLTSVGLIAAAALFSLSFAACGDGNGDDDGDDPLLTDTGDEEPGDTAGSGDADGSVTDTDGTGDGPPSTQCGVSVTNLGTLAIGDSGERNDSLQTEFDSRPDCADSVDSAGATVYAFRLEEGSVFEASASGRAGSSVKPSVEVHSGDCDGDREVAFCSTGQEENAFLEPDRWHFVRVYGTTEVDEPHFTLRWDVERANCQPAEYPTCGSATRTKCPEPTVRNEYDCFGECASEDRCVGDTCEQAATIDLNGGAVNVRADRLAYEGEWNAAELSGCEVNDSGSPFDSKGVELFAELQGVSAGDTIVFDSVGEGGENGASSKGVPVAFLILSGCGASSCTMAGLYDEETGDNRIEWTAESDGPFVLVAEVLGGQLEDDVFEFDVIRK